MRFLIVGYGRLDYGNFAFRLLMFFTDGQSAADEAGRR